MSVTETRKQVSLRNAMDELQLPEAAKKYYEERLSYNSNTPYKLPDDYAGHVFADMLGG